jgi:hypothetical protein
MYSLSTQSRRATVEPPEPQQLKVDTLPQTLPLPCYADLMECVLVSKWMQGIEFFSKMFFAGRYLLSFAEFTEVTIGRTLLSEFQKPS